MAMAEHLQAEMVNETEEKASSNVSADEEIVSLDEGIERCARLLANMAELGGKFPTFTQCQIIKIYDA